MPIGPGKYDDLCTLVRGISGGRAAMVIIVGGVDGSGFSVQSVGDNFTEKLPEVLETMAAEIRASLTNKDGH